MDDKRLDLSTFTLRQLMELDGCTRCGECITWCPTFAEKNNDNITPLRKIERQRSFVRRQYGLWARLFGPQPIPDKEWEAFSAGVYDCTLCARCAVVCPVGIETRSLWLAMREQLAVAGHYPAPLDTMRHTVLNTHNMAGDDNANRLIWAENLEHVPEGLDRGAGAEMAYFVGCVGGLFPQAFSIPQSLTQILTHAGNRFTTLGGEEWCCGFPLLLAGFRQAVQPLVEHNVAAVRALGVRRLITTCPSCYHTWKHDYPRLLGEPLGFEILHATELLAEMIEKGQITLQAYPHPLTYHDPCDLGRTSGIYEAPRRIIRAIPGVQFTEMADHHERSLCCGGGGDVEMCDVELTAAVARRRLEQAAAIEARVIVSACQQCKRTLTTAARKARLRMNVLDITELVWQAMQP